MRITLFLGFTLFFWPLFGHASVALQWLDVGDINNPPDPDGFGSVSYKYRIAKDEITNGQYIHFLNDKATLTDPLRLYNPSMGTDPRGGITRSGSGTAADPYFYGARANMDDKPVNFVSWYDAIRLANWMNNGAVPSADTESGAYTLLGGTPIPTNAEQITRNPGARVFLPSNDEWHKAALYEPAHGYWSYGTRSDDLPTGATANATGDVSNPGANVANYNFSADWNGLNGNVTTVGSCGAASESYYGLDDATGNVAEWCEDRDPSQSDLLRMLRGGAFVDGPFEIFDGEVASATPSIELNPFGFRLASAVPEPSGLLTCGVPISCLAARRRHR